MRETTGIVFNIQKFSIHDGPSIRDVVFLKGCPLRCVWCSNPESQKVEQEVAFNQAKCIGQKVCGTCQESCPRGAISFDGHGKVNIDRELCQVCHVCEEDCCAKALVVFGKEMTVQQVLDATLNQPGCWRSNGGVTLSGGEPLMQAEFAEALLKEYQNQGVHTAIETTGFASWDKLDRVARYCDLIFYDLKIMTEGLHKTYIGAGNQMILNNLTELSRKYPEKDLIVRTPVIPGINDSREELEKIVAFLKTLPHLTDYELLPYHAFGSGKYKQLGREYGLEGVKSPDKRAVEALNGEFRRELFGE